MGALRRRLAPIVGVILLIVALGVLWHEVRTVSVADLAAALRSIPHPAIALAILLTAVNYAVLTGYDQLAFVYLGRAFPRWQITMASFVGYAIANNLGFAVLSGTSARYRFYSRWGLSAAEISRIVVFYSGTFWLGLLVLGGWSLRRESAVWAGGVVGQRAHRDRADRRRAARDCRAPTRSRRSSRASPISDLRRRADDCRRRASSRGQFVLSIARLGTRGRRAVGADPRRRGRRSRKP